MNSGTFHFDAWAPNHYGFLFQVRLVNFSFSKNRRPILSFLLFKFYLSFRTHSSLACSRELSIFFQLFVSIPKAITIGVTNFSTELHTLWGTYCVKMFPQPSDEKPLQGHTLYV